MNTATARPTPIILKSIMPSEAKIANTATMTIAALVTTPAVARRAWDTASAVDRPWSWDSRTRLRISTW